MADTLSDDEVATLVSGQHPYVVVVMSGGRRRMTVLDVVGPYFGPNPAASAAGDAARVASQHPEGSLIFVGPVSSPPPPEMREFTGPTSNATSRPGDLCSRCGLYTQRPLRRGLCVACRRRAGERPKQLSPWEKAKAGENRNPGPMGTHEGKKARGIQGHGGTRRHFEDGTE